MYFEKEDEEEVDLNKLINEGSENNVKEIEPERRIKTDSSNEEKIELNISLNDDNLKSDINDNSNKNLIDNEEVDNLLLENDLELFIGFTNYENLNGDISENSYYNLPLKERITKRLNEEKINQLLSR